MFGVEGTGCRVRGLGFSFSIARVEVLGRRVGGARFAFIVLI